MIATGRTLYAVLFVLDPAPLLRTGQLKKGGSVGTPAPTDRYAVKANPFRATELRNTIDSIPFEVTFLDACVALDLDRDGAVSDEDIRRFFGRL